jgi:Mn2+/Fe2+ NRAMP family transporter
MQLSTGLAFPAAAVTAHPNLTGLPGSNVLQQIVNGAEALAIALLGAFVGAAMWAIASHSHNPHYASRGRMAALVSAASALVIGAGPGLVNFFERLGTTAK